MADAAFGALNYGDLDAFLALTAEDVEFTSMIAEAEGTTFRGHQGVRAWWATVRGGFKDVRWEVLEPQRRWGPRRRTLPHRGHSERRPGRAGDVASHQVSRRQGDLVGLLSHGASSPRSRGAARVGDGRRNGDERLAPSPGDLVCHRPRSFL
jgi:SnoaL-like domain